MTWDWDGYSVVIIVSGLGFCALAAALLIPVYRFMRKEDEAAREFDAARRAELERRLGSRRKEENGNGHDDDGGIPVPTV